MTGSFQFNVTATPLGECVVQLPTYRALRFRVFGQGPRAQFMGVDVAIVAAVPSHSNSARAHVGPQ